MSAPEIIEEIQTQPMDDRKAVLKFLSQELEEAADTRLFDERSGEQGGRPLREIMADLRSKP